MYELAGKHPSTSLILIYDLVGIFKGLVGFNETNRYYLKMMCLKVYKGY